MLAFSNSSVQTPFETFVMSHCTSHLIAGHYNSAVTELTAFRNKHIRIVARYIILPSKASSSNGSVFGHWNLTTDWTPKTPGASENTAMALLGTGGTQLTSFLKQTTDETRASIIDLLT
jgi:indoleamine 2,3-dioxygenase